MHRLTKAIITSTEIMQTEYFYRYTCLDQSINLCVLSDECYELFCVFGDFCAAGTQEEEVPKSLVKIYLSWGRIYSGKVYLG